ncbi:unnamed protein product [Coregonus sp. 'balchen']|nr:unnamed protein product [Coregonus sp. 'balchen']
MSFEMNYSVIILIITGAVCTAAENAPESIIYPRDEVELGVENTLICFVNGFFPPPVKVNWTKNGMEVTEGLSLSRYYPNKDGTFHQFSSLSFTPQKEDVYYKVSGSSAGPGPAVFCGVGLTLGLLGVATGIFLYKGKESH